ncbi:peptidase M15A, partial [Mesorhizobium sp. M00.F.Ca.ET.158.01.1.1]
MTLKSAGWSLAKGERRAIVAALCSVLLASCTSAGDPTMSVGMPGYNASASDIHAASTGKPPAATDSSSEVATEQTTVMSESDA